MRPHIIPSNHQVHRLWRLIFWALILIMLLLISYSAAAGQCIQNPTGETAVGLQNDSSYYLIFYIDGERKDAVPAGDRSVDFIVPPGEHTLMASALVQGETISVSRTANFSGTNICTWTVTDPPDAAGKNLKEFQNYLRRERLRAFVPLVSR